MSTAVKTVKRDYARVSSCPDAATVLRQLDCWFEHYNTVHPHKAVAATIRRGEPDRRVVERSVGLEPTSSAWKGEALPLDEPRIDG